MDEIDTIEDLEQPIALYGAHADAGVEMVFDVATGIAIYTSVRSANG